MLNTNHILFPTDFSEYSKNALPFALEIADRTGARLTLFHVIETPFNMPHDSNDLPETHAGKARKLIEEVAENILQNERYSQLKIDTVLENGNVVTAILEHSQKNSVDLIVMGTKGSSKMKSILYGSIASHIILDSEITVLAVPGNSHSVTFDPVTFATDYREGDWYAFKHAIEWADTFNSDLNVLHVAENRDMLSDIKFRGFRDMVTEKTPNRPIQFDLVVKKRFLTGVADYMTDHPVGLLVLVRYKKNRIQSMLKKDHTKELSYYTKVPLLILIGDKVPSSVA